MANFRHRALRHHSFGIFEAERVFGVAITNSDGKQIPVRFIGEQHVREDCGGRIPSPVEWLHAIPAKSWMSVGKISGDAPPAGLLEDGLSAESPASFEAWQAAVARGETSVGHREWLERLGFLMSPHKAG